MKKPHDLLFHRVFQDLDNARSHLASVLPERVVAALDLTGLALAPSRLVDVVLKGRENDLLFTIPLRGGGEAIIFVLLEHQTRVDGRMAWRVLQYMVRAWDFWQRNTESKTAPFPPIIPLVLYHGERRWTAPLDFTELLAIPDELRDEPLLSQPSLRYAVQDLSQLSEEELRGRAMVQLTLLLMQRAHTGDLLSQVHRWADLIVEIATSSGMEGLRTVLTYMMEVEAEPRSPEVWRQTITDTLKQHPLAQEQIMGLANWLRQQGREEGREEGIQIGEQRGEERGIQIGEQRGEERGIQIGEARGQQALLVRLLTGHFGTLSDAQAATIAQADLEHIELWVDRLFTGSSIDEVLAGAPNSTSSS